MLNALSEGNLPPGVDFWPDDEVIVRPEIQVLQRLQVRLNEMEATEEAAAENAMAAHQIVFLSDEDEGVEEASPSEAELGSDSD